MRLKVIEAGEGPPVVLLHGLFGMARNLGGLQRAIAGRHRVLAMELRNHGDSPHAAGMAIADLAGDVAETMAAMGTGPAAVIGHSLGGKTAMMLALTRPELVSRLLVADIAPVPNPPSFDGYIAAMRQVPLHPGLTRREAEAALVPGVKEAGLRGFFLQNLRLDPPGWRIGLDEIEAGMAEILDWRDPEPLHPFAGPALFLAGARSDYVKPEHRPVIRRLFPAARHVVLRDAGHWLHADNPAGFLAVVEAFLAA
jgi:esterase